MTEWGKCELLCQFKNFEASGRFFRMSSIQHYIRHTLTPSVTAWRVKTCADETVLSTTHVTKCQAVFYKNTHVCIIQCLGIKLLRLIFLPWQRSRGWPIFCHVGTLDLDSVFVKTRRISIHPLKSYNGNRQTDRRTDGPEIRIKCSLKSDLIRKKRTISRMKRKRRVQDFHFIWVNESLKRKKEERESSLRGVEKVKKEKKIH